MMKLHAIKMKQRDTKYLNKSKRDKSGSKHWLITLREKERLIEPEDDDRVEWERERQRVIQDQRAKEAEEDYHDVAFTVESNQEEVFKFRLLEHLLLSIWLLIHEREGGDYFHKVYLSIIPLCDCQIHSSFVFYLS